MLVQVDTGSSDLLVYGSTCSNCPLGGAFNSAASTTSQVVSCSAKGYICRMCRDFGTVNACGFDDRYGDGSEVTGAVLTDRFGVGDIKNIQASFG